MTSERIQQNNQQTHLSHLNQNLKKRVVEVRQFDDALWHKRVFVTESKGRFLCWNTSKTLDEINTDDGVTAWKFMREVGFRTILTKTEIAEKFGVDVENLEIR